MGVPLQVQLCIEIEVLSVCAQNVSCSCDLLCFALFICFFCGLGLLCFAPRCRRLHTENGCAPAAATGALAASAHQRLVQPLVGLAVLH